MTHTDVQAFYDDLADDYHLVYADWEQSVSRQAEALDRVVASRSSPGAKRILDVSCGIGTQSIGLAALGHEVVGTDISPKAVGRARQEAERAGVHVRFAVCDLRSLEAVVRDKFDVVISCDNSLPHLTSEEDLRVGLGSMVGRLVEGGLLLVTTRDYDQILADRPTVTSPSVSGTPGERRLVFQIWNWQPDGRTYRFEHVMGREGERGWEFKVRTAVYRAVRRHELTALFEEQGLASVEWRMPEETGFFQPLVTGLKR